MKKLFTLLAISVIIFFGCQEENSLVQPVASKSIASFSQSSNQTIEWVALPIIKKGSSPTVQTTISDSKKINGKEGGEIEVEYGSKNGPFGEFDMHATLQVPKNAFSGSQVIKMTLDDKTATATFNPHPMSFAKPLKLDLEYQGINLDGVNPAKVYFAYLGDDGTVEIIKCDKLEINKADHSIKVEGAQLNHFSRFGFVR